MVKVNKSTSKASTSKQKQVLSWREKLTSYDINNINLRYTSDILIALELSTDFSEAIEIFHDGANNTPTNVISLNWNHFIKYAQTFAASYTQSKNEDEYILLFKAAADEAVRHLTSDVFLNAHVPAELAAKLIKLEIIKIINSYAMSRERPSSCKKSSVSSKSTKGKKEVKTRNPSMESIAIIEKEQLFIIISGCYDPYIIQELFKCGVKLSGIIEIAYPETFFEGYDCKHYGSKSSTDTIMEFLSLGHTDGVLIYKRSAKKVDSTESIYSNVQSTLSSSTTSNLNVNLKTHSICHFWTVVYSQLESDFLADTAHLRISPIYSIVPKRGTPEYELQALEVFSHISSEIMKLPNAKRQHANYIENIKIYNIDSSPEKMSIDSLSTYKEVVNSVSPESVTISLLLHGLAEEVCTRLPDNVKSPSEEPSQKSDSSKLTDISQYSTAEVCTPLLASDKSAYQESVLIKATEKSKCSMGLKKVCTQLPAPAKSASQESMLSKAVEKLQSSTGFKASSSKTDILSQENTFRSLLSTASESQSKSNEKLNRKQMLLKELANYLMRYKRNYAPLNRMELLHHKKCFNDPRTKIKIAKNTFTIHETSLLELETLNFPQLFENIHQILTKNLLRCPLIQSWLQRERLNSAQIFLKNYLMANLKAHLQLSKEEISHAMNLSFFKTLPCSAHTEKKNSTRCDDVFRCNFNAEWEMVEIFESCVSSTDLSFHLSHINSDKEQMCVKIPYADVIDEPSIYESKNIPTYLWYEELSPIVALQQINKAYHDYICVDQLHCPYTDSMLIRFHNDTDEFGINTKTWQQSIRTPVGLRDFGRFVMHEEAHWLKKQEKKNNSQLNDIVQTNEAHLQNNTSTARTSSEYENCYSFLGYNFGKSRLQLSGGLITFHSLDGYKVTVDKTTFYGEPKKVSINVTIKDHSFIVHHVDKRSSSKEPFVFHFVLADGTFITFNRPCKVSNRQLIIGELIKKRKKRKVKLNPNSTYEPRNKNVFYTVEMEYCDVDFGKPHPLADLSKSSMVAIYKILPMQLTGLINPRNPTIKFVTDGHSFWAGDDISVALMEYSKNCSKYKSFIKNRLISRRQSNKQLLNHSSIISPELTFTNAIEPSLTESPEQTLTISAEQTLTVSPEKTLTILSKHSFTESSEQSFILSPEESTIDLKTYKYLKPYYGAVNENIMDSASELDNKYLYELNLSDVTLSRQNSECGKDNCTSNFSNSFIPVSHLTVSYNSSVLDKINELEVFQLDFTGLHSSLMSATFSNVFETTCKIVSGSTNGSSDTFDTNSLHVNKELQQFVLNLPALAYNNCVSSNYGKYCVPIQTRRSTILSDIKLTHFIFPSLTFIERGEIEFCPIDIMHPSYASLNNHSGQLITYRLSQNSPLIVCDSDITVDDSLLDYSERELQTLDLTLSYLSLTSLVDDILIKIDEAKQRQIPLFKILSSKLHKFVYVKRTKSYIHIQIGKNTTKLICKHPHYKVKKTVKVTKMLPIKMSRARFTNDHFYDMKLSLPSGLLIYTIPGINGEPFNIKQQYLHKGPQTKAVVGEESRSFLRSGRLVIRKCDGTIHILSTNGQMVQCKLPHRIERTYAKYSIIKKNNSSPFEKQHLTKSERKIGRLVCHFQKHIIGGKYKYYHVFPKLRKIYNKSKCRVHETEDPLTFVLIADDGRKCTITGTQITYKDKIFQSHHELRDCDGYQELYYSRDDGVKCLVTENSVLTTEFYDGTRITTWPIIEPKMIGMDELDGHSWETTVSTGSSLLSSDVRIMLEKYFEDANREQNGWISVNIVYKFEHPNYATIMYGRSKNRAKIILPNNTIITATETGFYKVNIDGLIRTNINNEHIHIESNLCQSCNQTSITTINVKPMYQNTHPVPANTRLLKTSDTYQKTFFVSYDGICSRNSDYMICHSNKVCCKAHDKQDFQKLYVLNRDLSATKFWDAKAYRKRMTEATNYSNSVIEFYDKIANSSEKYRSVEVRTYNFKPYPARFTTSYKYPDLLPSKFQRNLLRSPIAYCLTLRIRSQSAVIKSRVLQNFISKLSEHQADLCKFTEEEADRYIGMLFNELPNTKTSVDFNYTAINKNTNLRIKTKPNKPQSSRYFAARKYLTSVSLGTDIKLCSKLDLEDPFFQEEEPKKFRKRRKMVDKEIQCGCENKMTSKSRWELLGLKRPQNTYFKPGGNKTQASSIDMTKLEAKADFLMRLKRLHGKPKQQTKAINNYVENCIRRERKPSRVLATGRMENAYFKIPPTTHVAPSKKQEERKNTLKTNRESLYKPKLASEVWPLKHSTKKELKVEKVNKPRTNTQQLNQKWHINEQSKLQKFSTQQFRSQQPKSIKTGQSKTQSSRTCKSAPCRSNTQQATSKESRPLSTQQFRSQQPKSRKTAQSKTQSSRTCKSAPCKSNTQQATSKESRPLSTQQACVCQPNAQQTAIGPSFSIGTYTIPPSTESTYCGSFITQPSVQETCISPITQRMYDSPTISPKSYSSPTTQKTHSSSPNSQGTYDSPPSLEETVQRLSPEETYVSSPSSGSSASPASTQKTYVVRPRSQRTNTLSSPQSGFSTPTTQKSSITQRTYVIRPANQRSYRWKDTDQRTNAQKPKTQQTPAKKSKDASTDTNNLHIIAMLSSMKSKEKEASKYKNWKRLKE